MENLTPLVSIVMAVHNEEMYLEKCIDSIVGQTYSNWELIAVNDHSEDHTPEILKKYADNDPRIRVFDSKGHKLIPALQEAYRHCRGTLINRMDADDYMPAYKLQILVEEWEKYGKGTIIAGGTSHFVDKGVIGEGFKRYDRWLNDVARRNAHYEEIYQECVIPSHCWIIHKNDFDAVGAFDPEVYPEDYDLCFRFYKKGLKVVGIDKILHYWRDHSIRISRTWDCYKDNRYFDLKLKNFYKIDRNRNRPLILWGAGRNGKDLAKLLLEKESFPFPEGSEESQHHSGDSSVATHPSEMGNSSIPEHSKGSPSSPGDSSVAMHPSEIDNSPIPECSVGSQEVLLPRIAESEKGKPGNSSVTALTSHPGSSQKKGDSFIWVCDNVKKIGKEIYGVRMQHFNEIPDVLLPQILIVVNSPEERVRIREQLKIWNKKPVNDFWFFT